MQYKIIVIASIIRFILVFPVPVTLFRQIVATDIIRMAIETTRKTGIAASRYAISSLKSNNNSLGKN
jgi:hypothetical protein